VNKLNLGDIKIMSPGQQVKKIILDRYGDIANFAEEINMEAQTVNQYLKEARLGSRLFRSKLCDVFGKGLDEIVKSKNEQIKNMVQDIYDNIKIYKDANDIHTFKKVQALCIDNNLELEFSKMNRNIGMYYFYYGAIDRAIGAMKVAISSIKNPSYLIKWKSELGIMYFLQCDYVKSRKMYEDVEELLDKVNGIDEEAVFLHYYRYGVLENNTERYSNAEKYFRKSLEYAKTIIDIGDTITNIGLSFKLRKSYEEAIEYYNKGLDIFEDDLSKSRVFNNLAELYKLLGEYDKALNYIRLAFNHVDRGNISKCFIYFETYAQIQISRGEYREGMDIPNMLSCKQIIIEVIHGLIDESKKTDNISKLKRIEAFIENLIRNTPTQYEKYLNGLYACIGEIRLYILSKEAQKGA